MATTLSSLLIELNERVDDTINGDTATRWLNKAYKEALNYYQSGWPWHKGSATATLAGDTAILTFASGFSITDFGRMVQVVVDDVIYDRIDWEDKDNPDVPAQTYCIEPGETGIIFPNSDTGTATIKYIKAYADLTNAADTLGGIPTKYLHEFTEAVVYGAMARYYEQSLKPSLAQYYKDQMSNELDSIITEVTRLSSNDATKVTTVDYNESGEQYEF